MDQRAMMPNLTYFSPKVEKRASLIEGRGLFARAAIAKGEVVVKGGYVLTREQRDRIGEELGKSEIQITKDLFIGSTTPAERAGGMMHLRHCCEPNLVVQIKPMVPTTSASLLIAQPIAATPRYAG
jgi:hypothetical protein